MAQPEIKIFACGGTIDKVYFDAKSEFQIGEPQILTVLREANVRFEFEVESILKKDSLDMTTADREAVLQAVLASNKDHILITHGTDTIIETAKLLEQVTGKVIVLTGSMEPAKFRLSDAVFNIGMAIGAVQSLTGGVWIAMNGRLFRPSRVRKNLATNSFEDIT